MTLSWISVFLEAQAADFGAARNTQEAYGRDLKDFLAYLEARGPKIRGLCFKKNGDP